MLFRRATYELLYCCCYSLPGQKRCRAPEQTQKLSDTGNTCVPRQHAIHRVPLLELNENRGTLSMLELTRNDQIIALYTIPLACVDKPGSDVIFLRIPGKHSYPERQRDRPCEVAATA
jgi:hypothetical protein